MRRILLLGVLLVVLTNCDAPDEDLSTGSGWEWARQLSGPSNEDEIDAIATDTDQNVYLSGKFEAQLTIQGHTETFQSLGKADIMVAKYDRLGELQWAKQFGGSGEDNIFDADCDQNGNVILSGYFEGSVQFGDITLNSLGGLDMVVLKIDPMGDVLWAVNFGGMLDDGGNEVTVSGENIIVGAQSIGNFTAGDFAFENTGGHDAYLLSITPNGIVEWVRAVQGSGHARAKSIAVDNEGTIFFGGDFEGENYVVVEEGNILLDHVAGGDAYITSWTKAGELRWTKSWGGNGHDLSKGVGVLASGEIYVVGQFEQTVDFEGTTFTARANADLFIWKLTSTGQSEWVRHIASDYDLIGAEVTIDQDDNLVFGIGFSGTLWLEDAHKNLERTIVAPGSGTWPVLLTYNQHGSSRDVLFPAESENGKFDEIAISGTRIYIDLLFSGGPHTFGTDQVSSSDSNKDAAIVAVNL